MGPRPTWGTEGLGGQSWCFAKKALAGLRCHLLRPGRGAPGATCPRGPGGVWGGGGWQPVVLTLHQLHPPRAGLCRQDHPPGLPGAHRPGELQMAKALPLALPQARGAPQLWQGVSAPEQPPGELVPHADPWAPPRPTEPVVPGLGLGSCIFTKSCERCCFPVLWPGIGSHRLPSDAGLFL